MMIFYTYLVPLGSELDNAGVDKVFIAYNPADGETAFFNVTVGGRNFEDGEILPFTDAQMAIVNRRYVAYCAENNHLPPVEKFDRAAYDSFMRSL